jgi:putative hemolysin
VVVTVLAADAAASAGSGWWFELAAVFVLVALNFALAGSEAALVALRPSRVRILAEESRRGARLAQLASQPSRWLASVQIGITLAGFLASATAAVALSVPLRPLFAWAGTAAEALSVVVVTLILTLFTLVFGELTPKRLALARPEKWALRAATPLLIVSAAFRPLVAFLGVATDAVVRLFGVDPDARAGDRLGADELRELVRDSLLRPEQAAILRGALELDDRTLRQVLVPRGSVLMLDGTETAADAARELLASGHSRAPVRGRDADDILGVAHLRDLVRASDSLPTSALTRPIPVLPESIGVLDALRQVQHARAQMALVVDEHGGTEGIVTVEDLLEEIVGEIADEFDRDVAVGVAEARSGGGAPVLPGTFPVHDLVDVGFDVPEGPYATVAGVVLDGLGRIPDPGDRVTVGDVDFEVREMSGHRITSVQLRRVDVGSDVHDAITAHQGTRPARS